jgi:hypothetical protein
MFRASSHPSSGAQQLQQQHLILPSELGDSSAVGLNFNKVWFQEFKINPFKHNFIFGYHL